MMGKKDERKIAIYSRKSKFTGKGESIENQVELCRQHIKLHNPSINDSDILIFEDEGFSGKNVNRPKFQAMIKELRENRIRTVVCYRLDRISRDVGDFAKLKDEFDDYKVEFISIRDNFDTTTPGGRAMMMMVSVFAQLERETIAERIRDNMHELAKSGRWLGGETPTGYKSTQIVGSITVDGKQRKAHKLDIIQEEAETIKLIYAKFLETNSLTKTDTYLLQNNITTKNNKNFSRFTIKAILQNPVYLVADKTAWDYFETMGADIYTEQSAFDGKKGMMVYNKTVQKDGKANRIRNIDEWIIAVGKHKGIIKSSDWVKVQLLLTQNHSKSYRKPRSNVALLSGLLYCGHCNSFMRPKLSQRLNSQGEKIYSYLCETKERSKGKLCNNKNPNGNELDKVVCQQIKLLSEDSSEFFKELEGTKRVLEGSPEEYDQSLSSFKKKLQENEEQIKTLVSAMGKTDGTAAFDYITEQINELHEKSEQLKQRIKEIENLTKNNQYSSADFDILRDLLVSFEKSFDTMNVEQKRQAIRTFVKRIIWDGEKVHIYLFGDEIDTMDFGGEVEPLRGDSKCNPLLTALCQFE